MDKETNERLLGAVSGFLGGQRDAGSKKVALDFIMKEISMRPSIDEEKLRDRLELATVGTRDRYLFAERFLIPEIRAGRYDGKGGKASEGRRPFLSSRNMFEALRTLGVTDDSEDGFGYERVDYYLNAVWVNTEITIEEIHKFSEGMIVWIEAKKEWRTATKVLKLCGMSKTLGAHMAPEEAMERVEREVAECKRLEKEWDEMMEGLGESKAMGTREPEGRIKA